MERWSFTWGSQLEVPGPCHLPNLSSPVIEHSISIAVAPFSVDLISIYTLEVDTKIKPFVALHLTRSHIVSQGWDFRSWSGHCRRSFRLDQWACHQHPWDPQYPLNFRSPGPYSPRKLALGDDKLVCIRLVCAIHYISIEITDRVAGRYTGVGE